jgi:L-arabonate dehydrase
MPYLARSKRRSAAWFDGTTTTSFIHRSRLRNQGVPDHHYDGRPVIGICNTWSDLTPCNAHLRALAERVKRGVYESGGFPLEFPVMSLGETLMRPTSMLYRNLASMDVEESIRSNPLDGVVLLGGCDKTVPALLMGAASCNLPTIMLTGGPMLTGRFRGKEIGVGTFTWKSEAMVKAGDMSLADFMEAESATSRSIGHCNTMGTASTMAGIAEALGVALSGNMAVPAADAGRNVLAHMTGRRIVEMVNEDLCLSQILTREAFENAIRTSSALGGSTNAVVHLIALARRLGVPLELADWDRLGDVPCLANVMPSGNYLMEDFYYAGGLSVVLRELGENGFLHKDARTIGGITLWEQVKDSVCYNRDVIHSCSSAQKRGGVVVLSGNLAPSGAIIKPSAATPKLMQHHGRAVVFENLEDYKKRIDSSSLEINASSVMVLKNCGPKGYPGMPEVGNMALPAKILRRGITDMIRISDARMSGTAYGTAIIHVSPEAAVGGPLACVKNGDRIELDVNNRSLTLCVSDEELARRKHEFNPPNMSERGWEYLYSRHVNQAHEGCDLDFLVGASGADIPAESH